MILGHPWGKQPHVERPASIGWTIFLWLVYLRLVTVRLVTDVRSGELAVAMRGLWRERRIPLNEIKSAKAVTYDPARDYGGYGIRTTRRGTAYIAGGNRGVRLELAKGGTVLIGSARPEELAAAIHSHVVDCFDRLSARALPWQQARMAGAPRRSYAIPYERIRSAVRPTQPEPSRSPAASFSLWDSAACCS